LPQRLFFRFGLFETAVEFGEIAAAPRVQGHAFGHLPLILQEGLWSFLAHARLRRCDVETATARL
jgi:hypothetical protein